MHPQSLTRARLLMAHRKWDLAEAELRRNLAENLEHAESHRLLALCLAERKDFDGAEHEARTGVELEPDHGEGYRVLAAVLADRRKFDAAAPVAEQAIALNPHDVEAFGILAFIRQAQENWPATLHAAEQGLAIDPEHAGCTNFRAMALVKLGRAKEAGHTFEEALARNPENAYTHANRGWSLLEQGKTKEALHHFSESLKLEPGLEWARAGLVEGLKSRNFIYRWLLQLFLFMQHLSPQARWGIVIGAFVLQFVLRSAAQQNPALAPYAMPILIAYGAFALLTWLAEPLFSLLLFADPLGRRALSNRERLQALGVGGWLGVALVLLGVSLLFWNDPLFENGLVSAICFGLVSLPLSAALVIEDAKSRYLMLAYTAALAGLALIPGAVWILVYAWPTIPAAPVVQAMQLHQQLFVPGFIGSQFLAMWLRQRTVVR